MTLGVYLQAACGIQTHSVLYSDYVANYEKGKSISFSFQRIIFFFSIRYQRFMANFSENAICLKGGILFGFKFFKKKKFRGNFSVAQLTLSVYVELFQLGRGADGPDVIPITGGLYLPCSKEIKESRSLVMNRSKYQSRN